MESVGRLCPLQTRGHSHRHYRTDLEIAGALPLELPLDRPAQDFAIFSRIDQRLAVIGEGQRNQTPARYPAFDTAENDRVFSVLGRPARW
jgi:hypothetical protein